MGVIINNQNTKILGFALKGRPSIPSANKKYETIEIEGRDGSLTRFLSYEDLKFSLTFNILFQDDIKQKLREIKGLMSQANTLSFDDSPNFFYKIKQAQVSDTESVIRRHGVFSVDFVADSFEYEASSVLEYQDFNLATQTSTPISITGTNTLNQITSNYVFTDKLSNLFATNDLLTLSFNWSTTATSGKFIVRTLGQPYTFGDIVKATGTNGNQSSTIDISPTRQSGRATIVYKVNSAVATSNVMAGDFRIDNLESGKNLTISNYKLERGNKLEFGSDSADFNNIKIRNNTTYFSQPIIKIFGQGNIKLYVNDELIEFKNLMDGIILDSEKQEAYLADVNKNAQMVGNFPNFEIGENQIIAVGNVNKIEILPNWRWLT